MTYIHICVFKLISESILKMVLLDMVASARFAISKRKSCYSIIEKCFVISFYQHFYISLNSSFSHTPLNSHMFENSWIKKLDL